MASVKVDVVIPVYNAASTLEDAVRSIQAQSLQAIRIVLIDDGSTDATPDILGRLAANDSRIVLLRQRNSGIVDALNRGWGACDAPLIARHDADDLAAPDRLAKQVAFLEEHPAVVAVSGAFRHIDLKGKPTGEIVRLPPLDVADPTWVPAREPYLMHPFLMLRRIALEAVGGYRYVFHAEDADLYWRLQEHGVLYNLPDVLGDYRLNPNSVSSKSILNGRIQSLGSQLAAVSAVRRRAGKMDIVFKKDSLCDYHSAQTLSVMIAVASSHLTKDEARYISVAVSEKLRGLSAYRPYELEHSDCKFISAHFRYLKDISSAENRREVSARLSGAAAQLILRGRVRSGVALCPPALYAATAVRTVAQLLLPKAAWRRLRELSRRPQEPPPVLMSMH